MEEKKICGLKFYIILANLLEKEKVTCRNSWPLTIACHIKKTSVNVLVAFATSQKEFLLSLYFCCFPIWWCKSTLPTKVHQIKIRTVLWCQIQTSPPKPLLNNGFSQKMIWCPSNKIAWKYLSDWLFQPEIVFQKLQYPDTDRLLPNIKEIR